MSKTKHGWMHDAVANATSTGTQQPPLYSVLLLNDDYTPMNFVVEVLETFFAMHRALAIEVMLRVHTEGEASCGVFSYEIAETKAALVNDYARNHGQPLLCVLRAAAR